MIFEQRIMVHNLCTIIMYGFRNFFGSKIRSKISLLLVTDFFSGDIVVILVTESHVNVNILLFCFGSGNNEFKKVRKFPWCKYTKMSEKNLKKSLLRILVHFQTFFQFAWNKFLAFLRISLIFFLKWRHSDRKWSIVVACMIKWPNDHFRLHFYQKTYSGGILKRKEAAMKRA